MTSKAHRRRSKGSVTTKQAFEENENEIKSPTEEILDQSKSSSTKVSSSKGRSKPQRLYEKAFFTINNLTVEVILDNNILSWASVSGEASVDETQKKTSTNKNDANSVDLHKVYAISPIHNRLNWQLTNNEAPTTMTVSNVSAVETQLRGFQLHIYDKIDDNVLQEILIIFQSILPNQIERWYQLLSKLIVEYKPVRNVLVICNPYAGTRSSRNNYNIQIRPFLERARYNISYLEINDDCSADEVLNDFHGDFDSIYGLVVLGGDGSVIKVINALIRYLAKENGTRLTAENDLPPFPFPISIVPVGTTNIISHSIYGNTDICTPIIHLLFNQRMNIDMSAIFDNSTNFVTANFSTGAGYPANALKYFQRYSVLSSKKIIQKSFLKATSSKNLKPIEMEIRYIPADQNTTSGTRCYQGCSCTPATTEHTDNQVQAFDNTHLQKISKDKKPPSSSNGLRPSSASSRKNSNQQNETDKPWTVLRNNYLQVAVLTNATLWSFAPQGLSKFGHLADGLLDLVLIEPTTRKDFVRYLKRNGSSKNPYEFPFAKSIKIKEIEIELKFPNNDCINNIVNINNKLDSSLSDDLSNDEYLNNENKLSVTQKHEPRPPSAPMPEDSRRHRRRRRQHDLDESIEQSSKTADLSISQNHPEIDLNNSNTSLRGKNIFRSFKSKKNKVPLPRPSSASANGKLDEKSHRKNRQSTSETLRPGRSFLSLLMGGNASSGKQDPSSTTMNNNNSRRASIISRSSSMENIKTPTSVNNQSRNNKQSCMWNLDFTPYNSSLIRMKCFQRFLPVFGVGLNPDTIIKEVNYSCF